MPSSATEPSRGPTSGRAVSAPTIGIDLGGSKLLGVVLDADGEVVAEERSATPEDRHAIVVAIVELVGRLRLRSEARAGKVRCVGIGAPGLMDRHGVLRFAPNLRGAAGINFPGEVGCELGGIGVVAENDATAALWGERALGAASGCDDVILVTLGTGIGGGMVSGGRLLTGRHGFAGELGHVIVEANGLLCPCGQRGCWERYASGSGLGRLGREAAHAGLAPLLVEYAGGDPEAVRGEHVVQAATAGDEGALAVMDRFGWWLAIGLVTLANIFDTEMILLGGGLAGAGDVLIDPATRHFDEMLQGGHHRTRTSVVAATLGERAGAIGAAVLARDHS